MFTSSKTIKKAKLRSKSGHIDQALIKIKIFKLEAISIIKKKN